MVGPADPGDLTSVLLEIGSLSESGAGERLFAAVYQDLHAMAADLMRGERVDHTLRPTALVHEVYLRLIRQPAVCWENRAHFFGIAARAMRQVLVEHARRRAADKRGGGLTRITLGDAGSDPARDQLCEVLDLHAALDRLATQNARMASVVEFKAFGGLETREIAHVLGVSKRTVENDWTFARMWLARELSGDAA